MFSKLGKYFLCFFLFIFVMTITADAFTAIRQEELGGEKPKTRFQRKAHQRRLEEHPEEANSSSKFVRQENTSSNTNTSGGSSYSSSGNFVRPTETPTSTPTVNQQTKQKEREKARKTSNTIVIVFLLLVVGGLAVWYFTRNVNFKKLKQ